MIIKVSDAAGNFTTNTVKVSVNDVVLSLTITNQTFTVRERASSNTLVGTIQVNADTSPSFTLTSGNVITNIVGTVTNRYISSNFFTVDAKGRLLTTTNIDYEKVTNCNLTVQVRDADNNITNVTISVQVTDVLDEIVLNTSLAGHLHYAGISYYKQGFLVYNYTQVGIRFNQQMVFESNVFQLLVNFESSLTRVFGIHYLNEILYFVSATEGKIYRITNNTVELSSLTHSIGTGLTGITSYNGSFYLTKSDSLAGKVYQLPLTGGSPTTNFRLHADNDAAYGIEYLNGSFYVVDITDAKVYRYSTNFTFQEVFDLDPECSKPFDITYDSHHSSFWIMHNRIRKNQPNYGSKAFRYHTNFTREF